VISVVNILIKRLSYQQLFGLIRKIHQKRLLKILKDKIQTFSKKNYKFAKKTRNEHFIKASDKYTR
jgi:hypothetical protein